MGITRNFEPAAFIRYFALSSIVLLLTVDVAFSQTTALSYQGSLSNGGTPANGNYDIQFKLFDALSGGLQKGPTITKSPVAVTNGSFAVALDFGGSAFPLGADRFLEISVQPTGGGGFTTLTPRTPILSTPYAITAQTAATVTGPLTGNDATATLSITNSAVGATPPISNPPPAALKAETTSPSGSTAGLLGISDSNYGAGVFGVFYGSATPNILGEPASGVFGIALSETGPVNGVTGITDSSSGIGVFGHAERGTGQSYGVAGKASSPDGAAILGLTDAGADLLRLCSSAPGPGCPKVRITASGTISTVDYVNAFFGGFQGGQVLVGPSGSPNARIEFSGHISTNHNIDVAGNLTVTGTKSSVAKLPDGRSVLLYAVEAPENWFEDFGTLKLVNGRAVVKINSTFVEATNTTIPYEVFLTPNGNTRGLYVMRKTATSFKVCENGRGHSNVSVDYRIVAKRLGHEAERFAPAPMQGGAERVSVAKERLIFR